MVKRVLQIVEKLKELLRVYHPWKLLTGRLEFYREGTLWTSPATDLPGYYTGKLIDNNPCHVKFVLDNWEIKLTREIRFLLAFLMLDSRSTGEELVKSRYAILLKRAILKLIPIPELREYELLLPLFIVTTKNHTVFAIIATDDARQRVTLFVGTPRKFIRREYGVGLWMPRFFHLRKIFEMLLEPSGYSLIWDNVPPILGVVNYFLNVRPYTITHNLRPAIENLLKDISTVIDRINHLERILDNGENLVKKIYHRKSLTAEEQEEVRELLEVLAIFNIKNQGPKGVFEYISYKGPNALICEYLLRLGLKPSPTANNKIFCIPDDASNGYFKVEGIDLKGEIDKVRSMIISSE